MHEHEQGRKTEKLAFINSRYGGDRIPTIYGKNRLGSTAHFYSYDGGSWSYQRDHSVKELYHYAAIIYTSFAAFGVGITFLIRYLFGGD